MELNFFPYKNCFRKQIYLFLIPVILIFLPIKINSTVPFFITGIPKTGCHLVMEAVKMLNKNSPKWSVKNNLEDIMDPQNRVCGVIGHFVADNKNLGLLRNNKLKGIFIYRDPRDQIVSHAFFLQKIIGQFVNINEKISDIILGQKQLYPEFYGGLIAKDINNLYGQFLEWKKYPNIYTTTFEKLVGPKGGGSATAQLKELKNIAQFLKINITDLEISAISKNIFGSNTADIKPNNYITVTFRKGEIGSWKKYFTEEHKKDFKRIAGKLLIDLGYEKDYNW